MMKDDKFNGNLTEDSIGQEQLMVAFAAIESGGEISSDREDRESIMKIIEQAAEGGMLNAQMWLGNHYLNLVEADKMNLFNAFDWFDKAAKQGSQEADEQRRLCRLLILTVNYNWASDDLNSGDPKKARRGFQTMVKLSESGCKPAILTLARFYAYPDESSGTVTVRDVEKAKSYLNGWIRNDAVFGDLARVMLEMLEAEEAENTDADGDTTLCPAAEIVL